MRRDCHLDKTLARLALAATFLAVTICPSLGAQTVRGTVVDSATTRPLTAVTAELVDSVDSVIGRAVGDDSGRFSVTAPDSGNYRLQLRRIGYRTALSGELTLGKGAEMTVSVRLPPIPVKLAPLRVEATRNEFLVNRGYYQRKESERGTFLDPAAVEKKAVKAKIATDILIGVPGVSIAANKPYLRTCRALNPTGGAAKNPFMRFPAIFIDGVEGGHEMMWSLQPNDILAVEIYMGPSQIPLQYGGTNELCGVILIWTRH